MSSTSLSTATCLVYLPISLCLLTYWSVFSRGSDHSVYDFFLWYKQFYPLKHFIYLFLDWGEWREKERERSIGCLLNTPNWDSSWPATQACALSGNRTQDLSVCGTMPSPLSHISQGCNCNFQWLHHLLLSECTIIFTNNHLLLNL